MNGIIRALLYMSILLGGSLVYAQDSDEELNILELELEQGPGPGTTSYQDIPAELPPAESASGSETTTTSSDPDQEKKQSVKSVNVSGITDLSLLAPFKEVSVIQKRFMPKTERIQLFGGLGMITNDPYFNTISLSAKASYFFSETWGLELNYFANSSSDAKITQELKDKNVATKSLIKPNSFVGLDLVYVPIYGKMAWLNDRIVPFDLYFSGGFGTSNTNQGSAGTIHLATGQIFAITKSMSFRWDFSWNFFSAKGDGNETSNYNNLFLTAGVSFFFPEAGYR